MKEWSPLESVIIFARTREQICKLASTFDGHCDHAALTELHLDMLCPVFTKTGILDNLLPVSAPNGKIVGMLSETRWPANRFGVPALRDGGTARWTSRGSRVESARAVRPVRNYMIPAEHHDHSGDASS